MSTEHSKRAAKFTADVEKTTWHDATFWSVRQREIRWRMNFRNGKNFANWLLKLRCIRLPIWQIILMFFQESGESWCQGALGKDAQEFNEIVLGILNDHHVKKW